MAPWVNKELCRLQNHGSCVNHQRIITIRSILKYFFFPAAHITFFFPFLSKTLKQGVSQPKYGIRLATPGLRRGSRLFHSLVCKIPTLLLFLSLLQISCESGYEFIIHTGQVIIKIWHVLSSAGILE